MSTGRECDNLFVIMKLSIITINYNNCQGLRKTIDSVINQTWQDFEWIIVDGGSSDGSRELIEETASQLEAQGWTTEQFSGPENPTSYFANHSLNPNPSSSHRLLWCSEKDKGVYNAMNKGIVQASGEYCIFLNSGDWLVNENSLVDLSLDSAYQDIVYGIMKRDDGELCHSDVMKDRLTCSDLLYYTLPHQAAFIKRDLFNKAGMYNEELKIVSDWEFFVKVIVFYGASYKYIPVEVSYFEGGGVSDNGAFKRERAIVTARLFPEILKTDIYDAQSWRSIRKHRVFKVLCGIISRISNHWT